MIVINARFLTQEITGVQRFAIEISFDFSSIRISASSSSLLNLAAVLAPHAPPPITTVFIIFLSKYRDKTL